MFLLLFGGHLSRIIARLFIYIYIFRLDFFGGRFGISGVYVCVCPRAFPGTMVKCLTGFFYRALRGMP